MYHTSHIELSRAALRSNLRFLKSRIGELSRLVLVVKGNAYGHGIEGFVPLAEACGQRHFATSNAEEGWRVTRALSRSDSQVIVMGEMNDEALEWAISEGIAFHVFDMERLKTSRRLAERLQRPARIHLELETGMNRLGLEDWDREKIVAILREHSACFEIEGTCTHLAGAENIANYVRIQDQLRVFEEGCRFFVSRGLALGRRHVSPSSGIFFYPEAILDQVRVGIAAYGFWPTQEVRMRYLMETEGRQALGQKDPLKRVISWKSLVMAIKDVTPGQFVNYGLFYQATKKRRVAIVPVGYSEGFSRALSNRGRVLINGRRCQVIGAVNMNMISVDVTGIPEVKPGTEVVLIGRQKRQQISISSFSNMSDEMNYEVLVRLPERIPRVVVS